MSRAQYLLATLRILAWKVLVGKRGEVRALTYYAGRNIQTQINGGGGDKYWGKTLGTAERAWSY